MAKKKKGQVVDRDPEVEQVLKWHSAILAGEARRENYAKRYRWEDFIDQFKGHFHIDELALDPEISIPPINLVFAYLKTEIPSLYLRDPHFEITPKQESSILSAKIREMAINYIWRQKRMKRESKKNIWDGKLVGHSWFKTGYTGKFMPIEDGNGHISEYVENEDFFGYRVSWKDISFNPEAIDPPHDCRWIAHRFFRPLADVQANERYSHTKELLGSPLIPDDHPQRRTGVGSDGSETLWVKMYEVWDIVNKQVFVVAEGLDRYLEKPKKWRYKMRGFPFSFLSFNPVNDEPYPVPDVYQFETQILELMKIRAMQLDHLKRFNRQMEAEKGALDDEAKVNLSQGRTGAVIEVNQIGKLQPISYPSIQTDIYAIEERVKEDLINVSGQSPMERGGAQKTTTRTIGELLEIQKGAKNRRSEQVDTMEDFLEDCARNLISLLMQYADTPFYIKLTGKESQELLQMLANRPSATKRGAVTTQEGFTFTKEDIQGEYDIDVKVGSTVPLDRENKINLLISILDLIPKLGAIPGGPVIGTLALEIASELDMPSIERAIQQEIQLQQKMKAEAEAKQQEAQRIEAAKFGVEKQLDADKIQSSQTGDLLKVLTTAINASGGNNKEASN
jgi:hypothetical protein